VGLLVLKTASRREDALSLSSSQICRHLNSPLNPTVAIANKKMPASYGLFVMIAGTL